MRHAFAATLLGLALATPAAAQAPNVQQLLQGLTTGNQGQDQALRDAFERGYQRGRQDEARQSAGSNRRSDYNNRDSSGDRRGSQQDDRGRDPGYGRSGNGDYSR